jgi:hypothetical protein
MPMNKAFYLGYELVTAVVMWSSVFFDITTCSPLKVNQHFVRMCHLQHKGRRINQATNQLEAGSKHPEYGGEIFLRTSVDFKLTTWRYVLEDNSSKFFVV